MKVIREPRPPPAPPKEVPFLFIAPMSRALRNDSKTQTRRILSARNSLVDGHSGKFGVPFEQLDLTEAWIDPGPSPAGNRGPYLKAPRKRHDTTHRIYPRVQPGDRVWVKETWGLHAHGDSTDFYRGNLKRGAVLAAEWEIAYRADWQVEDGSEFWRPSIFCTRWASRTSLDVLAVRPERLHDLTDADALAEGCLSGLLGYRFAEDFPWDGEPRHAFRRGWNELHRGKRSHLWFTDAKGDVRSPWVWVIAFRRAACAREAV